MNHQLDLKTAAAYGRLLDFVPVYQLDDFRKRFEDFLDAYDADNEDKKSADIKVDAPRTIPKVGEVYRYTLNYRLKVLAVLNDADGYIVLVQNCSDFLKSSIRLMTLTDFEKLALCREN